MHVASPMRLRELLLGKKIPDEDADEERLGVSSAVPVLGLDALASAAYGPEAALAVLAVAGGRGPAPARPRHRRHRRAARARPALVPPDDRRISRRRRHLLRDAG